MQMPMLRKGTTADKNLIRREYYNPNKFDVIFNVMAGMVPYIKRNRITLGSPRIVLKSEGWAVLNHGYYIATASNGCELINLVEIYGDKIGTGMKHPSLPYPDVKWTGKSH